jgi:hypothetical protein
MSLKKDIFTQIGTYLKATLQNFDPSLNLPNLAFFDKQMGQFTKSATSYAIPLPCILMELRDFKYESVGKNQQKGNGILRFYIYFENYADAFTGSANQAQALRFYDFCQKVNQALQGFDLPYMAPLTRVFETEDTNEDMIISSTVDYGTIITDTSTDESTNFTLANPTLSVNKVHSITRPAKNGFVDGYLM